MASKKNRETAAAAVKRLQAHLKSTESDVKVVFRKPSSAKAIAAAEKVFGCKLPPSYVRFVTTCGAFKLNDDSYGVARAEELLGMGPHEDLPPRVQAEMDHCIVFQQIGDDSVENYYVFDTNDRNEDGELAVRAYFNDDRLQARRGRGRSFDDHISALCDELIEDGDY